MVEITDRDKEIFEFLFRIRYATANQLCLYLDCSYDVFRKRISKLIKAKYIESESIKGYLKNNVYSNGIEARKKNERKLYRKKVKMNGWSLLHHLKINDVMVHFIKGHNIDKNTITTEREMYWKKTGILDKKKKMKVPDLVIEKDKKLIAIEVEESKKSKAKLRSVFTNYSLYTSFYCVIYLCPTEGQKNYVRRIAEEEDRSFISAYTLTEFFSGVDVIGF